jgi:hypothetical protein
MSFSRTAFKGRAEGYRSGLEDLVAKQIASYGIDVQYELFPLKYEIPARLAKYTADFILPSGIIIETKGRFVTADRTKHRLIREQYPDLDIRFVFSNPNSKIGKKSATSYAMWCNRIGIPYAARTIPEAWFEESPNPKAIAAAKKILGWSPPSG